MTASAFRFCPLCAASLAMQTVAEDGGPKARLRCTACEYTHWNNPTPVLAAVIECVDREGQILLARNAAWTHRTFALITGFMEAGESPEEGIKREVKEETSLDVERLEMVGAWDFQRMNQVIIAYHVFARGDIKLSPELAEYKLFAPTAVRCWPSGTGQAMATVLRRKGIEPTFFDPFGAARAKAAVSSSS